MQRMSATMSVEKESEAPPESPRCGRLWHLADPDAKPPMSAIGTKQTSEGVELMSAFESKGTSRGQVPVSAYDPKLTSGGAAPRYHVPKSGNEWTVAALAGRRTLNSCRNAANWSSAGFCPCSLTGLHSRARFSENFGKPP
jgi:hypothetical protein